MPKAKKQDFIKDATIKTYIKDELKIRSSQEAIDEIDTLFNKLIQAVTKEAKSIAIENKRTTILGEDIPPAYDKHVGKEQLTWQETLQQILKQPPSELGKILDGIYKYIENQS